MDTYHLLATQYAKEVGDDNAVRYNMLYQRGEVDNIPAPVLAALKSGDWQQVRRACFDRLFPDALALAQQGLL